MTTRRHNWRGKLMKVIDGDTIAVDFVFEVEFMGTKVSMCRDERVRLVGIDAGKKSTQVGKDAVAYLEQFLGKDVEVFVDPARDRYGRLLGEVFPLLPIGADSFNKELVTKGLAVPWDGHGERPLGTPYDEEDW